MRIREMVRRTGVSERLLRYYEEQGLLRPERLPSGYRVYREEDVDTVRRIRALLGAGLNTSTIARMLPGLDDDGGRLVPVCPSLVADLREERRRMTAATEAMRHSRALLDKVIAAGEAGGARAETEAAKPAVRLSEPAA